MNIKRGFADKEVDLDERVLEVTSNRTGEKVQVKYLLGELDEDIIVLGHPLFVMENETPILCALTKREWERTAMNRPALLLFLLEKTVNLDWHQMAGPQRVINSSEDQKQALLVRSGLDKLRAILTEG